MGIRHQIQPHNLQAAGGGCVAQVQRTGAVRQHPAQKIFGKRQLRAKIGGLFQRRFTGKGFFAHHRRCGFGGTSHRLIVLTTANGRIGVFQRRHACHTHTRHAHHFARPGLRQQTMHHGAMAGHGLVGIRSTAGQHAHRFGLNPFRIEPLYRQRRQFGTGMGKRAAVRINGIMAAMDAVGAQNARTHPRRHITGHAQHGFHFIVAHRRVGQKCRRMADVYIE